MNKEWEIKRLDEVCNILNGGTPKTGVKEYWDGNVKWITPKDMGKLTSKFVDDTPRKITSLGLQKSSAKLIPSNSLILSTRAPIGHLSINTSEMATNQGCRGIIPLSDINIQYLYYFLSDSIDLLNSLGTGATFRELSTKALSSVKIPLPPIPEQKRIVKILDEAFAAIDKAKAYAEKNLQNSRELFDSYLNKVFANPGEDWEEKTLGEIASVKGGKRVPKGYKYENLPTDYPYITVADFTDDGTINTTSLKFISDEVYRQIERYTITSEDLYISIAGTIGKTGIIPKEIDGANLTENACKLIFHNGINKKFVYFFTKSPSFKYQTGINTRIAAQPKLALERLKTITMHLPGNEEQKKIVSKFDKLSSEIKKLEAIYRQKRNDLDDLKKSIRQKAFDGEL